MISQVGGEGVREDIRGVGKCQGKVGKTGVVRERKRMGGRQEKENQSRQLSALSGFGYPSQDNLNMMFMLSAFK